MSIADSLRLQALEQRVQALEEALAAANDAPCVSPTQRPSSALTTAAPVVVLGKQGGDRRSGAVRGQPCATRLKYGTAAHWLARLDRDRPDLAQRVRAKEISANAAAIEAGFRKRMISVPADADAAGRSGRAP